MKNRIILPTQLAFGIAILLAGCSGKGPDVVDPQSNQRAQTVLLAVDKGGTGELDRYSELTDQVTRNDYAAVNGGPLGRPIDAVYENDNQLFLHHRDAGEISVLDFKTEKKLATISGFPSGVEGQLCSMAFSNISQGWAVCYNSPNLYQIDQYSRVIADTFALDGNPTNVGTNGRYVFVSTQQKDGTGQIQIFRSNFVNFAFEKTLTVPSPVIYSTASSDSTEFMVVTAGGVGDSKPTVHFISIDNLEITDVVELESDPLTAYIGKEPTFAAYTADDFLYLALPASVIQLDVRGRYANDWFAGYYPVIGVEYSSGLLYAYNPGSLVIKRQTSAQEQLADVSVPDDVKAIFFLGTDRVVR